MTDSGTSYYEGNTEANTEFLHWLKETADSIDPDCYLVGEAWTDRDTIASLYTSGIDSLFDFPFADEEGLIAKALKGSCSASEYVDNISLSNLIPTQFTKISILLNTFLILVTNSII